MSGELIPITSKLISELRNEDVTRNVRALIVEDDDMDRLLMMDTLTKCHCDYDIAKDGKEALEAVKKYAYDLMFLDIKLPNIDGMVLLETFKSMKLKTHIVIVTGADRIDALPKDGYYGVVSKPLTRETASQIVAKAK